MARYMLIAVCGTGRPVLRYRVEPSATHEGREKMMKCMISTIRCGARAQDEQGGDLAVG